MGNTVRASHYRCGRRKEAQECEDLQMLVAGAIVLAGESVASSARTWLQVDSPGPADLWGHEAATMLLKPSESGRLEWTPAIL